MSTSIYARRAYSSNNKSIRTYRSVEFEVIARITHRLKQAIKVGANNDLVEALYENRVLWNTLAFNVAQPDNTLPAELRARIFYLSQFTNIYSRRVLRENLSAAPLVEINASIIRGLQDRVVKQ